MNQISDFRQQTTTQNIFHSYCFYLEAVNKAPNKRLKNKTAKL